MDPMSRPNVLFVICDQLRADHLGFAGNQVVRTPHIDAIAAGGTAGSERLVVTRVNDISHSPFYNLTVGGEIAEKALVLLYFTQRSAGNLQASGFRLLTDNVLDGSEPSRLQTRRCVQVWNHNAFARLSGVQISTPRQEAITLQLCAKLPSPRSSSMPKTCGLKRCSSFRKMPQHARRLWLPS